MTVRQKVYRPSWRRTEGRSAELTEPTRRSWRLRLGDFFSRMWFLKACRRTTFPEPVTLNLFTAPRRVFILGIFCVYSGA